MSPTRPRLFLVDTFGLIFRAFYGRARSPLPGLRTAAGLPTEAVYVFNNMLKRLIEDYDPAISSPSGKGTDDLQGEDLPEY